LYKSQSSSTFDANTTLHPDKSAVVEHSINLGHCIQFHDTSILVKKPRHMEHKATDTELCPDNMNREEGFYLSRSWKSLIQTVNDHRKALSRHR
jgi:hypothetical protein